MTMFFIIIFKKINFFRRNILGERRLYSLIYGCEIT
jgi:hypothetical protein